MITFVPDLTSAGTFAARPIAASGHTSLPSAS
jgi:hypothetical protein